MNKRTWLTAGLALGLTACSSTGTPPTPPAPAPAEIVTRFDSPAALQAFATNLYGTDPARQRAQVAAYVQATQATIPPAALRQAALPDDLEALLTVDERELLNLQHGMGTAGALTLEGWVRQAATFGFKGADGAELSAETIRITLQALAAQSTFTAEQRPLAIVAALWAARTDPASPTFGDDVLDPMQLLIMNNVLLAKLLQAQPAPSAQRLTMQGDDAAALKLFNDAYGTGKQLLSDLGSLLTGVKEFGEFGDCSMFLVNAIEMNLTADRTALWRQGNDGPFQAQLTAKAQLRSDIQDEDLLYYAKNGCAPSANRTFGNIQTRWLLSSAKNGTLNSSGGPTDAQGTFRNTFTTEQDTSRMIDRVPQNKRTDAVTAKVLVSQLSATYPHLEWRMISHQMGSSANLGKELRLNVSYYEPTTPQWRLTFKSVQQWDGPVVVGPRHHDEWYETTTGEVLFELDPERSGQYTQYLTPVGGSFSVTHSAEVCTVDWPDLVSYPLAPYIQWSVLVFSATENPTVMEYMMNLGTLDQTMVNVSWTCPNDTMTYSQPYPKFPSNVGKVGDYLLKDFPTFDPTQDVRQLQGRYVYRYPNTDTVITTDYTLTRVDR